MQVLNGLVSRDRATFKVSETGGELKAYPWGLGGVI